VPVAVYDGLVKSVRANLKPLFRYFDLRRRALGLRELHHYDTYVPLVPEIETRTSFDQAVEMVLAALAPLGKEYVDVLREGLRGRWVDRYESKGKRSGAFSSGSYGAPPYILMNYKQDVFADVYTLAHESGHSMHSWFAQESQLFQDYEYPIFLAAASTFNEELPRIICSSKRAIRRRGRTSSIGRSTISAAHFFVRRCSLSLKKLSTPSRKTATR
jgi:oligoendopeptidase F